MNQSSNNGFHSNETAIVEPRTNGTSISPAGEWRDAASVNSSGRYAVEESGGLDFSQLLAIAKRRWKLMLAVLALCVAGSVFVLMRAKPVYSAQSTIELNPASKASIDTSGIAGLAPFANNSQGDSVDTQVEIIKGAIIQQGALKLLPLDVRARLRGLTLTADQRGTSSLVDVQVTALDPVAAASFANAVGKEYREWSLKKNRDNSYGAVAYVLDSIKKVRQKASKAQDALSQYKKQTGIYSLSDEASALSTSLTGKQTTLDSTVAQRAAAAAQLLNLQQQVNGIPANKMVPAGVQINPAVTTLQGQLTQAVIQRSNDLSEYTPTSLKVQADNAQIVSIKKQLSTLAQTQVSALQPDPRRAPLVQTIATTQAQVWGYDATIAALKQQIASTQATVNRLPDQEYKFAMLQNEVQLQNGVLQQLQQSLANLQLTVGSQTPDGDLTFPASPNYSPIAPDKKRILLTGLVLGIIGALALAMCVDALDNRIYNEDDAQRATHLPVLAQIPFIKQQDQQSLYLTGERVSPLLESNRMLRANISFCATDRPVKAVVVTSSVPNEGKSNSALNLAVAAALSGENVVLIDLDLRRPTQHVLTGLPNTSGFTNVIAGQVGIVGALQDTPIPKLRVLTSGPTPPNPYRMLNSHTAKSTIQKIISMADFVVIDTPPMLGLADARLISSLVDGTLMVISCQETGRREASRAADLMASANQEVLGTVLTKVPNNAGSYGSYATYQRYGRYFDESQRTAEQMDEAELAGKLDAAPSDKSV